MTDLAAESEIPALEGLSDVGQVEAIANWFLYNFEDPVHHAPHDSREGGYIFVYGGPYDA